MVKLNIIYISNMIGKEESSNNIKFQEKSKFFRNIFARQYYTPLQSNRNAFWTLSQCVTPNYI